MKIQNGIEHVGGIISRIKYSLSEMTELAKSNMSHFSFTKSLDNKYLIRSLTSVFLSPRPPIRLFDPQNCSSLFSQNLISLIKRGDKITGVILTLLTIPIFIYCSSNRNLIKRRSSTDSVKELGGISKQPPINWVESFYFPPSPVGFLSVLGGAGEKTHHHYCSDLEEDKPSSFHYGRLALSNSSPLPFRKNTMLSQDDISLSYKDIIDCLLDSIDEKNRTFFVEYANQHICCSCYRRSPSLFGGDVRESEFTRSLLKDKLMELNKLSDNQLITEIPGLLSETLSGLSKYISSQIETSRELEIYSKNEYDSMNKSMGSTADEMKSLHMRLAEKRHKYSVFAGVKGILHLWNIERYFRSFAIEFPPLLLSTHHLSIAEVAEFDSDKYINPSKNNKQFFQNLESFCRTIGVKFDPCSYSQIRDRFKKLVNGVISTINKFYTIHIGGNFKSIDTKSSKSLRLEVNFKFSLPFCGDLGMQSIKYFPILDFWIPLDLTGGSTNESKNSNLWNLWNRVGEIDDIDSTDFLGRLYERDRFLYSYWIYALSTSEYFHTLASEYFLRIKYRLGSWAGGDTFADVTGIAIEQGLFEWEGNMQRLCKELLVSKFHEYTDVKSGVRRCLDTIRDLSFPPYGKSLVVTKSDLEGIGCRMSKIRSELLDNTNCTNSTRENEEYSRKFSFLYRVFIPDIIHGEVMVDTISYLARKLDNMNYPILRFLISSLDIDGNIQIFRQIFQKNIEIFTKSGLFWLVDGSSTGAPPPPEAAFNPSSIELSCIKYIGTNHLNDAPPATATHNRNLLRDDFKHETGLDGNSDSILESISIEVNRLNPIYNPHLLVSLCAGQGLAFINKSNFFVGRGIRSYSDILDNYQMGPDKEFILPHGMISFNRRDVVSPVQSQVSDSLLAKFCQRTEEGIIDRVVATDRSTSSCSGESKTSPSVDPDPFTNPIPTFEGLLTESKLQEMVDLSLSSCSICGNDSEETFTNSDRFVWRPRPCTKESGLNRVDSQVHFKNSIRSGSSPRIDLIANISDQKDLSLFYSVESEKLKILYWSERFSSRGGVALRSLTRLIESKVLYENTKLSDISVREQPIRRPSLIAFGQLSKNLTKYQISRIVWGGSICGKWNLFREYIPWFFTPNWWKYLYELIMDTYPEIVLRLSDDLNYNFPEITEKFVDNVNKYIAYWSASFRLRFGSDSIDKILARIDQFIPTKMSSLKNMSDSRWSLCGPKTTLISSYLLSILFLFIFIKNYLPAASGSNFLYLWKRSNTIGYLIDPMRGFYLDKVLHSPPAMQMETKDLLIHFLKRFLNYTNNIIFYCFVKNELDSWTFCRESPDTPEMTKQLLTQYVVTKKTISDYQFKSNSDLLCRGIIHEFPTSEGSTFLSYATEICQNDLLNYEICKFDPAEKWILLAFEKTILVSSTIRQKSILDISSRDVPILPQPGSLTFARILLVGSRETGRSYVIRDIACNSYLPLVRLPLKRLLYNRSYFDNVRGNFISRRSVQRLNLILAIAREMSPCIIWIQDIHELNVHRLYHRLEADPKFLLCLILRNISNDCRNSCIRNNLVVASTHAPAKVDPATIAPNRLNYVINFRRSNGYQRQKELSIILRVKGFEVKADLPPPVCTGSETTGYSKRDLCLFANEVLLVGTSKTRDILYSDAIELAFHRLNSIITYMGGIESSPRYEIFLFRMGKVLINNDLIGISPPNFSFIGSNTPRKRFYYLSNWYLEPPTTESTIKEFTILPHILGPLAGLAAHDSRLIRNMGNEENLIVIDRFAGNDSNLVSGLSETLSKDFLYSEIFRTPVGNSLPHPHFTQPGYYSDILSVGCYPKFKKRGVFGIPTDSEAKQSREMKSIPKEVFRGITRSSKVWRLSFTRSGTYESIRLLYESNNLANLIYFHRNQDQIPKRDFELDKIKRGEAKSYRKKGYLFSYKRALGKLRQRQIEKLEDQLDNVSLREQFLELGISNLASQYEIQCNPYDEPILYLGGQFVWDPMLSRQPDHNIPPSRRGLLAKQELVRRLHVTYGMRRGREKHFPNGKISHFFIHRGYDRKSLTELPIKCWNSSPPGEGRNFEYSKETQLMQIYLQYPQMFVPVHLYQNVLIEDLRDRFLRFRLLVHRDRWMRRNRPPSNDLIVYNMLSESYHYLLNSFQSKRTLLDHVKKQLPSIDSTSYTKLIDTLTSV